MIDVADQTSTVDDFPKGIAQLAACINSDDTFASFRTFGRLHARILVQRQIELTALEKKIDDRDVADATDPILKYRLRGNEDYAGWDDTQRKNTNEASVKLIEYGRRKYLK